MTLWFTQKLEPAFSTVTVTNAAGQRVDTGKPRVSGSQMSVSLRPGGAGTYHVTWRVLSVDTIRQKAVSRFKSVSERDDNGLVRSRDRGPVGRHSRHTLRRYRDDRRSPAFPGGGSGARFAFGTDGNRACSVANPTMAWIGLAIAAASGVIWVQLQAAAMSGLPLSEAMTADVLSTVLNETQFGPVSKVRFLLAIVIAACLCL